MEYQATAKYIKMGPRKVQLVARSVHRMTASSALVKLGQLPKRVARPLADVITSALAGAKEKKADMTAIRIKSIEVLPGPAMKRWHAVSKGQAHAFKKRMTHIRVTLTDEGQTAKGKRQKEKVK